MAKVAGLRGSGRTTKTEMVACDLLMLPKPKHWEPLRYVGHISDALPLLPREKIGYPVADI